MGQVPPYRALFERLRGIADVILLDQRGTGRTTPGLDCPPDASLPSDALLDQERALAALLPPLEACAARLLAAGIEPADYTTAASADDIDDLRLALGAERLSLLGFSYGTELALAYVRRHAGPFIGHANKGVPAGGRAFAADAAGQCLVVQVALASGDDHAAS